MSHARQKLLSVVAAIAVVTSLVLSVQSSTQASSAKAGLPVVTLDYYVGYNGALANTLDPAHVAVTTDGDLNMMFNAGLVRLGTNAQVQADLASNWTISKNHKVYTFHIKPNARFSNGDKVTAADVKYSIERALAPRTAGEDAYNDDLIQGYTAYTKGRASHLSGVKVINPSTVQIRTVKPASYFLSQFTSTANYVLDPKVVRGHNATDSNNYLTNTCSANQGAGQFEFVCRNGQSSITSFYPSGRTPSYTLKPNPHYYGRKARIEISVPAVATAETAYDEYLTGKLSMVHVPPDHLAAWHANPRGQFHVAPTFADFWISLNTRSAPFNDANCRRAVAWSINRAGISAVLQHSVNPLDTILPPGVPGYINDSHSPRYNLQQAKHYFALCSEKTVPVALKYDKYDDNDKFAQVEQASMQAVGFKVTLDSLTVSDWDKVVSQPLNKTNTQATTDGEDGDPAGHFYLTQEFACNAPFNVSQWCNAQFNRIAGKADVTFNSKRANQLYDQAQRILLNDAPVVPTHVDNQDFLVKPKVRGLISVPVYWDIVPRNLDWANVTVSK